MSKEINWVEIRKELPPKHKRVLLANRDGAMHVEFIQEWDLASDKFTRNYTHWAYLPELPKLNGENDGQ